MTADRQAMGQQAGRVVLLTATLGTMLAPLNSTMIVVALPEILDDFGRSLAWGSWIVISYLVAMAAVQPLGGSLGDRYGRRRMLLVGFSVFLVATVAAALAPSVEVLLVARTVQALAGAMAIPNGTALVRALVPRERQGRTFGTIGSAIAVAAAAGPPLGGVITDAVGWRWIFVANVLLLVPAIALARRLPADAGNPDGKFDLRGAFLMTGGLVTLALALTSWRLSGVPVWSAGVFGLLALAAGVGLRRHVRRTPKPILNLGLFQRPGFLPASLTVLFSNLTMYTTLLALPVFLTERQDWRSSQVGLLLAGMSVQMIIFSPLGGRLSDQRGRRFPAVVGTVLTVIGSLPLLALSDSWDWWVLLPPLVVVGVGLGLSTAAVQTAAIEVVSTSESGQAAGLFSTMRYLGSILGSAMLAAILVGETPSLDAFRLLFGVLVVTALAAVVTASRLPGPETQLSTDTLQPLDIAPVAPSVATNQ
ncbi:MAG TPA: MFS transporter [Thermomicrobiales bacterium]|nr:MFS transporter [Thermomicrobiales bacterium]